jgi:hypothetical protein
MNGNAADERQAYIQTDVYVRRTNAYRSTRSISPYWRPKVLTWTGDLGTVRYDTSPGIYDMSTPAPIVAFTSLRLEFVVLL